MFKYHRNYVLFILFTGGMINYLDRSAFSVAAPLIAKDLGLNPASMGVIFSGFFVGYALFCLVGGYYSDKLGAHKVIKYAMIVWSIFVGLTGASFNFISLFIVRVFFGIGEGPIGSATSRFVYNWFPINERSRAVGFGFAGNPLGAAVSGPIVGFLAFHFGWRPAFFILAIIGILWVIWWQKSANNFPKESKVISVEELEEIEKGQYSEVNEQSLRSGKEATLRYFFMQAPVLATAFAFWTYSYILYFFLSWFPTYLMTEKHLNIKEMSLASFIPWIIGTFGLILSGYVTNWICRWTGKVLFSRKIVLMIGLLLSAVCLLLTIEVSTVAGAIFSMGFAVAAMYLTGTCYWTIIQEVIPKETVGGVTGFVHLIANTAGIVAPMITGFFVQFTGKYEGAFIMAASLAIMGVLAVAFFVKPLK